MLLEHLWSHLFVDLGDTQAQWTGDSLLYVLVCCILLRIILGAPEPGMLHRTEVTFISRNGLGLVVTRIA